MRTLQKSTSDRYSSFQNTRAPLVSTEAPWHSETSVVDFEGEVNVRDTLVDRTGRQDIDIYVEAISMITITAFPEDGQSQTKRRGLKRGGPELTICHVLLGVVQRQATRDLDQEVPLAGPSLL